MFLPPIYIQSEKFAETVCLEGSLSRFPNPAAFWEGEKGAILSHPQTTSRLSSLADIFFAHADFSLFPPNSEPSPRLLHYPSGYMLKRAPSLLVENNKYPNFE